MRTFASSESPQNLEKKGSGKKIVVKVACATFLCLLVTIGAIVETKGVTINNTHLYMHEVQNYKNIVENNLHPVVFDEYNDVLTQGFKCILSDNYSFSPVDIGKNIVLGYTYTFDETMLRNALSSLNDAAIKSEDAYIDVVSEEIVDAIYGTELYVDKIVAALDGTNSITLSDYYIVPTVVADDLQDSMSLFEEYRNWHISYDDSDLIIVTPKEAVSITESGEVIVNSSEFIESYLDDIVKEFNTVGSSRYFRTNNGNVIELSGGTFGNIVDKDKELEELMTLFDAHKSQDGRKPAYKEYRGEIGDTYIEVSIDDQHVWYYDHGEMILDSDCVTGNVAARNDTPKGFWYLDIVDTNRILRPQGSTTGSHVDRWMRFTPDGCGLHDASWRSKFGGTIYKYDGSHGCVNCPKKFAYALYEYAHIGLPVVVY